jgi:hypothetical protein
MPIDSPSPLLVSAQRQGSNMRSRSLPRVRLSQLARQTWSVLTPSTGLQAGPVLFTIPMTAMVSHATILPFRHIDHLHAGVTCAGGVCGGNESTIYALGVDNNASEGAIDYCVSGECFSPP